MRLRTTPPGDADEPARTARVRGRYGQVHAGAEPPAPGGDTPPARVHATVWAISRTHKKTAFVDLIGGDWPGADRFDLCGVVATSLGLPCPLDLAHPGVLATQSGAGWAWVVHDPATRPPLLEVAYECDGGCACHHGGPAADALRQGAGR